ncbi:MAG: hypothetical protein HUJ68_03135 [Clostridia bacterium]|nr:hypothetical protein [Clostridia bacterium]
MIKTKPAKDIAKVKGNTSQLICLVNRNIIVNNIVAANAPNIQAKIIGSKNK